MTTLISTTTFDGLRSRFRGALLRPGEEGYDEARRVWNGAIDRRPRSSARCAGTDDVVTAVRFARAQGVDLSVKGGGHSVAGHAVCDDGLMLDLSLMRACTSTPRRAPRGWPAAALWSDVDKATAPFGLAVTGGQISHTGVGGLTLAGGLGYLMRKHGLTVDSLPAVSISSPRRASACARTPTTSPSCSGACAAAAATSASRPRSSTSFTPSARSCWAAR